ncbi:MAG: hypothetical protein IJM46_07070 [Oscillospiraceae bacterium]|nr:hypothetical protein [Oscillospiraceae bacterium]
MMIPIYWGTQEKLKKDLMIGIDWCPNCQKFTEQYLGRRVKQKHVDFIPLSSDVLEHYLLCGTCNYGNSIQKSSYEEIEHMFQPFSKRKDQIKCFEKAAKLAETLEANEFSVTTIMNTLAAEFPVRATQQLEGEYRRRFKRLLLVHGIGGSPQRLMQPQEAPPVQAPQTPQQRQSVEMDTI